MKPFGLLPLLITALALAGCKLPGATDSAPIGVASAQRGPGGFLQVQSADGLTLTSNFSTLKLHLTPKPDAVVSVGGISPSAGVGNAVRLPGFTKAIVTAQSPTRMVQAKVVTLGPNDFDSTGLSKEAVITRLPAVSDMDVRVYLQDGEGNLVGVGVKEKNGFSQGANTVEVVMVPNAARPQLLGASDNINVSDGVVVKGAVLDLTTGLEDALPAIGRVDIEVSGPAYASGRESGVVASLKGPAFKSYSWQPTTASGTYAPAKMAGSNDKTAFTLTAKVLDPFGNVVASPHLDLQVVGTAQVDVGVDHSSLNP